MSFLSNVAGSYKKSVQKRLDRMAMGLLSQLRGRLSGFGLSCPIGSLGDIVFEVSSSKVRTFRDYKRTTKARYASHEVIGAKPILEFIGPDGEEITFTMQFSISLGVEPSEETAKIREMCEKGKTMYFVLCNETIGENMWIIESVGESVDTFDNNGRVILTQIDVTIKEYVPAMM
jgi:phage protein U